MFAPTRRDFLRSASAATLSALAAGYPKAARGQTAERLPATEVPDSKLRPLLAVLPVPPLRAELRRLIEWTADYYCASLASVARMVLAKIGRAHV